MNVITYLEQIQKIDFTIERKIKDILYWKSVAENVTPDSECVSIDGALCGVDKVQAVRDPQKMANAVNKYVDIEREIEVLTEKKNSIIEVMKQTDKPIYYKVLYLRYVERKELYCVARELGYSYSYIRHLHSSAIRNVQKILQKQHIITQKSTLKYLNL